MTLKQRIRIRTMRLACGLAALLCLLACLPAESAAKERNARFVPELTKGQTLVYDIHGRVQRHVKTQSRVSSILEPRDTKQEFSGKLRIKIESVESENGRPVISARADFEYAGDENESTPATEKRGVEFTIAGNGQVKSLTGFDDLDPLERIAWQFWLSRFAFGWTLPSDALKPGAKWKSEEPEDNPAPIARLAWERETTYGERSKCPVNPAETCAIFLTNAQLRQKSSATDSTPEDYRLHELRTSGTATGTNEMYTTISQQTGLAQRGTEDVRQSMSVVIAKADASNGVKYTIDATSHFEMLLMAAGATATK